MAASPLLANSSWLARFKLQVIQSLVLLWIWSIWIWDEPSQEVLLIWIQTSIVFWPCSGYIFTYLQDGLLWKAVLLLNPWHNQTRQQGLKEAEASNAQGISEIGPNIHVYKCIWYELIWYEYIQLSEYIYIYISIYNYMYMSLSPKLLNLNFQSFWWILKNKKTVYQQWEFLTGNSLGFSKESKGEKGHLKRFVFVYFTASRFREFGKVIHT